MLRGAAAVLAPCIGLAHVLGKRDQFRNVVRGHVGANHEEVRNDEDLRDIGEVLQRIVGKPGHQVGIDDERGVAAERQRVTIGGSLGQALDRKISAGTGDVLDQRRLAPGLGEFFRHDPPGNVGRDSGREAHQDADRLLGIPLRERLPRRQPCRQRNDDTADRPHRSPPLTPL